MHEAKPFQASFTIFAKQKWWRLRNLSANFALKDFYAQTIENFVVAIPDMIESCRITKKVSFHNHLAGTIPHPADVYNCKRKIFCVSGGNANKEPNFFHIIISPDYSALFLFFPVYRETNLSNCTRDK